MIFKSAFQIVSVTAAIFSVSGCSEADPFGPLGWKDSDEYNSIATVNADADVLSASRIELFGREGFMYSLELIGTDFAGSCVDSELGQNQQGLNRFVAELEFQFPEDGSKNFSQDATILFGSHKNKPEEERAAILFFGPQKLPNDTAEKLTDYSQLVIRINDKCGNSSFQHFNITGDLLALSRTLDVRKEDALNKQVDEEFK